MIPLRPSFTPALLVALALALSPTPGHGAPAPGARFSGVVVGVLDGDTLDVLREGAAVRVRLAGIDCPEKRQPHGAAAKRAASDLSFGQTVTVVEQARDRYGRTVGEVLLPDGTSLNRELVRRGYAWWYRRYSSDASLGALEDDARRAGRGLWADPEPVPPWEFRRSRRAPRADAGAPEVPYQSPQEPVART